MIRRASRAFRPVTEGAAIFFRQHGLVYSAAIAFNILLAAIPILFLAFAATGWIIGKSELPFAQLTDLLRDTFPGGARGIVPNLRRLLEAGSAIGILGTILLLFTSFTATDAVHTSLSVMMMRKRRKQFWRSIAFHVVFVIVLIVLTAAAIVVPPLWDGIFYLTKGMSSEMDYAFRGIMQLVADILFLDIMLLGSVLSYRYLSPGKIRLRNAFIGTVIFLALLQGIKFGFVFYIRKFSKLNLLYGSLFSVICFILIIYLFAAAYLYGASVIGVLERTGEEGSIPEREEGEPVASDGGD
ncbi:YihY/virulence factor BrkB family protein [Candidatus Deferrimicrobium sp.]|uniref:YihY/virulence factor BrkB family protein n=1 Tax=Candidatus Deferrimicrobium sp. TaxID=3060586 RepID=UPI003C35E231